MIKDPEIAVDYSLSYREFVAGHKLALRQNTLLLIFHIFATYIAVLLALLFIAIATVNIASGQAALVRPLFPVIFLWCLLPTMVWLNRRNGFKRLKGDSTSDPQMSFRAGASSFTRQIRRMGEATWLWSATRKITENKDVILILVNRSCFIVLPRRTVSDDQLSQIKSYWKRSKEENAD